MKLRTPAILNGGALFAQVLGGLLVARIIGPAESGAALIVVALLNFLLIFCELGFTPALVQSKRIRAVDLHTATAISITVACALVGTMLAAAALMEQISGISGAATLLTVGVFALPLRAACLPYEVLAQRRRKLGTIGRVEVVASTVGYLIVPVCIALIYFSAISVLIGFVVSNFIRFVLYRAANPVSKTGRVRITINKVALFKVWRYCGWFTGARLLNFVATQADTIIVGKTLGAYWAGIYGRAFQLIGAPANLLGHVVSIMAFPVFARQQDKLASLFAGHSILIVILWMLGTIVGGAILLGSESFVHFALGSAWTDLPSLLAVLSLALPFRIAYKSFDPVYKALGLMRARACLQLIYALNVLGAVIIGSKWGAQSVAALVSGAIALHFLLSSLVLSYSCPEYKASSWLVPIMVGTPFIVFLFAGLAATLDALSVAPQSLPYLFSVSMLAAALTILTMTTVRRLGKLGRGW